MTGDGGCSRKGARTYNLREIERIRADGVENQVLKLVDNSQKIISEGCHDELRR